MRDHGGNLDWAMKTYGGRRDEWVDLSTGINPVPYPMPELPPDCLTCLPMRREVDALIAAAAKAYETSGHILPLAGAQAAIQLVPYLRAPGTVRIVTPTYNEHAAALRARGWVVKEVPNLAALKGAEVAIVVNPNNPDGRIWPADQLYDLAGEVGLLVIDESFGDTEPGLSVATMLGAESAGNILVMRSFGKFYGLAGLRLGFAIGSAPLIQQLADLAGPWAVNGAALHVGAQALQDAAWQHETRKRLSMDCARLCDLAARAGWQPVGGTSLFQTFETGDAAAWQTRLAARHIWTRIFPYSSGWMRLGLPGTPESWRRLEMALTREGE